MRRYLGKNSEVAWKSREPFRDAKKNGRLVHKLFEDVLLWELEQQHWQEQYEAQKWYFDAQYEHEQQYYQDQEEVL